MERLDEAIKLCLTKVTRESLDDRDGRRAMEIISFSINLEQWECAARNEVRTFAFLTCTYFHIAGLACHDLPQPAASLPEPSLSIGEVPVAWPGRSKLVTYRVLAGLFWFAR
jgi:hypothetical protein